MTENPLIDQLKELEQEHRDLDEILTRLQEKQTVDFLQIQRLKKRKLILKDRIIDLTNLQMLRQQLKEINMELWHIEDKIRELEKNKLFKTEFITLARSVYFTNDKRSKIKKKINELLNSDIMEEKSYSNY